MKKASLLVILLIIVSCSTEPVPLDYGKDGCHFCKMTIVDPKFGAEIVTSKGKVFKFDALECLVNYSMREPTNGADNYYVIDYLTGGWLLVENAYYLRAKSIPSPMGQYITALASMEQAEKLKKSNDGIIQTWEELLNNLQITNIEN